MDDRVIWIPLLAGKKIVSFLKTAHIISEPTPPSSQYLTGDLSPEVKQPGRKSDYYTALTVNK
jgi:hypothetical protein